jgi:hypothetical protein
MASGSHVERLQGVRTGLYRLTATRKGWRRSDGAPYNAQGRFYGMVWPRMAWICPRSLQQA